MIKLLRGVNAMSTFDEDLNKIARIETSEDFIYCKGIDCLITDKCKRYVESPPEGDWYFSDAPFKIIDGKFSCDMYWGYNQENILNQLNDICSNTNNKGEYIMEEFKVGDTVKLKTNTSPEMVISEELRNGTFTCIWFTADKYVESSEFIAKCLVKVS
jgi:uncharacterized protein YodC (DUF2158 family)